MSVSPDDELDRMSAAFNAAAAESAGPGKQKFVRLRDAFNAMCELAGTSSFAAAKKEFTVAMEDTKAFAQTDPDTHKVLMKLVRELLIAEGKIDADGNKAVPPKAPPKPQDGKKGGKHWRI